MRMKDEEEGRAVSEPVASSIALSQADPFIAKQPLAVVTAVDSATYGGAPIGGELLDFIDRCSRATSPEQIFEAFRSAAGKLGYDRIALFPVTPQARRKLGQPEPSPAITSNVPEQWVSHYFGNSYDIVDPVLLRAPLLHEPLIWDELTREASLTPKQRRVMAESRDAGLLNGVSIPLHGPYRETYIVSLATDGSSRPNLANLARLEILAVQFIAAYGRACRRCAGEPTNIRLTDRERECLTWTARGKSAWSIGKIIDVSEHTVNFHLKRGMAKLVASNRMQAVVTAIRLGLILP
jgi:LuxR family quorum-sensing system transcriptional regulator CciR